MEVHLLSTAGPGAGHAPERPPHNLRGVQGPGACWYGAGIGGGEGLEAPVPDYGTQRKQTAVCDDASIFALVGRATPAVCLQPRGYRNVTERFVRRLVCVTV